MPARPARPPLGSRFALAGRLQLVPAGGSPRVAGYSFDVVRTYRHDRRAYTQGLFFHEGRLYEGTGLYGESSLRETELQGDEQKVVRMRPLPARLVLEAPQQRQQLSGLGATPTRPRYIDDVRRRGLAFGEGIAIAGSQVFQLTWVEGLCFVWDLRTWDAPLKTFTYTGEGWGLTFDGTHLIMSDGSSSLQFRDPATFSVVKTIQVADPRGNVPVPRLNELEYVDGRVFANVYETRHIVVIDPADGRVEGYLFLDPEASGYSGPGWKALMSRDEWNGLGAGEVANGIAHDSGAKRLVITGKNWPTLYEIRLRQVTPDLR